MPDFSFEDAALGEGYVRIAGIDEAGRGPWAGPVIAAAVVLDRVRLGPELRESLDDSKKLSPARRGELLGRLRTCAQIGIGRAEVEEIDRLNILRATLLAMRRALDALAGPPDVALIDGNRAPELPCPARCVVGGDGRSLSIAAASIVAKVTRDAEMAALAGNGMRATAPPSIAPRFSVWAQVRRTAVRFVRSPRSSAHPRAPPNLECWESRADEI